MRKLVWLLLPLLSQAAVKRIHVVERTDVLEGRTLGPSGAYERVVARVQFSLDPKLPANQVIADLDKAELTPDGRVEFWADLYVLKPRDPAQGNRTVLFEVPNRGGKAMLNRFNFAASSLNPASEAEFGDLWLMKQGYTLAWLGWQWDVPEKPGLLRLDAPVAKRTRGPVRAEFIPERAATRMPLGDRDHIAYKPVEGEAALTVRNEPEGAKTTIPRDKWAFSSDGQSIEMKSGFELGRIYEVVYTAEDARVQGAGLAAVRDLISFFKHESDGLSVLSDMRQYIRHAVGFGISQSGRFLRTFIYFGMNADEKGRKVFDGIWADVAGAGRGSFNHRFAQASRDGHAFLNLHYPTDIYPFADVAVEDAVGGRREGLMDRVTEATRPKVFYTNGSYEYWGRGAALIHLTPDGKKDAPMNPSTRVYFIAGVQHGPGRLPPGRNGTRYLANPVDFRPIQRALLEAMQLWVAGRREPPASVYPSVEKGELVDLKAYKNPAGESPKRAQTAWRADYGGEFVSKGIVEKEPPALGSAFPILLPKADKDGIDVGGVRMPEAAAPLGALVGWNLRDGKAGAAGEPEAMVGAFMPMKAAEAWARYGSRERYMEAAGRAADELTGRGFLLKEDRKRVVERAMGLWDFVQAGGGEKGQGR